jgi:Flp pilus assembly protein TadG
MGEKMKSNYLVKARNLLRRYYLETGGATLMAFGLSVPVVVGAMGMSVDLARSYLAKERLSHALDAAALAGGGSAGLTEAELQERVGAFFYKNYPDGKIGTPMGLHIELTGSTIHVSAYVSLQTTFMQVLGVSSVTVDGQAAVERQVIGLEVAMVLDVTGSMSTNNNIGALRTASTDFTKILCPDDTAHPASEKNFFCDSSVKIGIVPFSASVNVGPYGLGKTPTGTTYDTAFVNNPSNLKFDQSKTSTWWGCILEQAPNNDVKDSLATWRWNMFRYVNSSNGSTSAPNTNCNKSYILPLTTKKLDITNKINGLQASGNTLSNIGMVWGYRVLSPEAPFREGVPFHDEYTRKVALLMTDGDNNIGSGSYNSQTKVYSGGTYSAYGPWATYHLYDSDLDSKLAATCQNMKDDGVTIYTVTFTSSISDASRAFFRNCASSEDKYYNAPTQADLKLSFQKIAAELSNLYVSQ